MPFSLTDPGYYNKMADGILAVITFNNYKEVVYEEEKYDPPKEILQRLKGLETEIQGDLDELEGMM